MAELTTSDLEDYTDGRLVHTDSRTALWLSAALNSARHFCGWYVCPVVTDDVVVVDGPGGYILSLPTLQLTTLTSITELGIDLDITKLDVSVNKGTVKKYPCRHWTDRDGGISVKMTHGFTEDQASDWRLGVLQFADLLSTEAFGASPLRDNPNLISKRIDDVIYTWSEKLIAVNDQLSSIFSSYMILTSP